MVSRSTWYQLFVCKTPFTDQATFTESTKLLPKFIIRAVIICPPGQAPFARLGKPITPVLFGMLDTGFNNVMITDPCPVPRPAVFTWLLPEL
ncbi:hypothetical protein D3C86_1215970 [compost metagenome]